MGLNPIGGTSDKTRWRVHDNGGGGSSSVHYLFITFLLCSSVGVFYIFYLFSNPNLNYRNPIGCQEDNEGSWEIGIYYGDSPFHLKPIEAMNIWDNKSAAWPIANPIMTCASITDFGFPSNFVADPFLYAQDDTLYMFFKTKNPITMQGDIAAARSTDNGASWEQLGVALDEDYDLSHPYVFDYNHQIYMIPDTSGKGDVRLYRALNFPLQWKLEKVILDRPLVDAVIVQYEEMYWLFGSYKSQVTNKNLEVWYSNGPFGPWTPHKKNPVSGPRNGGRPFIYNGNLYRLAHDERVRVFKIEVLTLNDYKEVEVELGIENPTKGINAWNGARSHYLDVHRLRTGQWVAVADGDRTLSGDVTRRRVVGCGLIVTAGSMIYFICWLLGLVKCLVPVNRGLKKKNNAGFVCERLRLRLRVNMNINPNTVSGKLVFFFLIILSITIMCVGFGYIYGGNGAEKPYSVNNRFSQFTLLAMTYDARMWNLKMYVKHYSRCASVREIVVVWNKGKQPGPNDLDSMVPVRIRVEDQNSLNNRFKPDPLIKTKAVLELDDDIMMNCDDLERAFKIWRESPQRIVGFYPRLVTGPQLKYRPEKHARKHNGYNMILTGAAFVDHEVAFGRYWGKEAEAGRSKVDEVFNCEDVLLNFLYANVTVAGPAVEYVKPAWAVDTSKFSGVAISGNTQAHYRVRSKCLEEFTRMYGGVSDRKVEFRRRDDGWDL